MAIDGMLKTIANRSLRSSTWLCTVWCERCHVHSRPCMMYLCVNQATNSQKRNVVSTIREQISMLIRFIVKAFAPRGWFF